jgi:hypothetical protein
MFTSRLGRLCLLILLTISGPALAQSEAQTRVTLLIQSLIAPPTQ